MARSNRAGIAPFAVMLLASQGCMYDWESLRKKDASSGPDVVDVPDVGAVMDTQTQPDVPPPEDTGDDTGIDAGTPDDTGTPDTGTPDTGVDIPVVPLDTPDVPALPDVNLPDAPVCTGTPPVVLVVNEVQHTGSGGAGSDEFVEILNKSDCYAPMANYVLAYRSAAGATQTTLWSGTTADFIAPHGYGVIAGAAFAGTAMGRIRSGAGVGGTAGSVALLAPDTTRVDSMGYGPTAMGPFVEGIPTASPGNGQSMSRIPDGMDMDSNSVDFMLTTSTTPGAANHL